jgi:hypothetical protein
MFVIECRLPGSRAYDSLFTGISLRHRVEDVGDVTRSTTSRLYLLIGTEAAAARYTVWDVN